MVEVVAGFLLNESWVIEVDPTKTVDMGIVQHWHDLGEDPKPLKERKTELTEKFGEKTLVTIHFRNVSKYLIWLIGYNSIEIEIREGPTAYHETGLYLFINGDEQKSLMFSLGDLSDDPDDRNDEIRSLILHLQLEVRLNNAAPVYVVLDSDWKFDL